MNCYYHETNEYIGDCSKCGKHLCRNCFDLTIGHLCVECVKKDLEFKKSTANKNIIKILIGIALGFVLSYFLFWEKEDKTLFVLFGLSIVPNYLCLGDLANKLFGKRIYTGLGIIIAFIIKCVLAYLLCAFFVGIIISIYYIIRNIYTVVKFQKNFDLIVNSFSSIE